MKIPGYFINLDRSRERARHMRSEADRLHLPLQRLAAVDGSALSEKEHSALLAPAPAMHRLSGPEIGCFLSHRIAWRKIATGENNFGAVFEDDIKFSKEAQVLLNDDSWLPAGIDIIKIETTARKVLVKPPFVDVGQFRKLGRLGSTHLGGGGYILSRGFAQKLLNNTQKFSAPVDYSLFDATYGCLNEVVRWQLFPAVCVQQVRSRDNFLPSGAETSSLDQSRKVLKRKGLSKLGRELTRPFLNLAKEFSARSHARREGGQWIFVDFKD